MYTVKGPNGDKHGSYESIPDAYHTQVERNLKLPVDNNPYGDIILTDPDITIDPVSYRLNAPDSRYRDELVYEYAYAIPTYTTIEYLSLIDDIVEIGAGKGYWAYLLEQLGVDIIPYDQEPNAPVPGVASTPEHEPPLVTDGFSTPFTDVELGNPIDLINHGERSLFICWPPQTTLMAWKSLDWYDDAGGDTVLYLGEGPGGVTGNDSFFEKLFDTYQFARTVHNMSWGGYSDALHVFTRDGECPVGDEYEIPYKIIDQTDADNEEQSHP